MKSTIYSLFRKTGSFAALVIAITFHANACGPLPPIIPTPKFFTSNRDGLSIRDFYKQENLRLWQELTSKRIPLKDIEQAVYENANTDNLFYTYLNNTHDSELSDFLLIAKEVEKQRMKLNSPWYYPSSRDSCDAIPDCQDLINHCKSYTGTRIKDRYALQAIRVLFASRRYDECINYFNETFQKFPDSNLFKRMAKGYVAGCWARLGNIDKSNEYFAQSGDFYSIKSNNPVAYMTDYNPDSPELMSYIQSCSDDSTKFCAIKPVAEKVLRGKKVKNRGDWEFILAYIYGEFYSDNHKASQYIRKALQHTFSSDDLRDHARAYRMKMDAENGNKSSLLNDLRWIETKIDMLSTDANEWNRMMQNIVYTGWIPRLWKKKDYTTAILLCGYADNFIYSKQYVLLYETDNSLTLENLRKSNLLWNTQDYCSLSFQLMGSLSSDRLIEVKRRIADKKELLIAYLKKYARTDADYLNELIGTLALREENYHRASQYFAAVSEKYLQTMNITKAGYLNRDPFYAYPNRWIKNKDWEWETQTTQKPLQDSRMIKYKFAKTMQKLQYLMKHGKNPDERGMARLKYAIGRRNSFEECWALTQYWRGRYVGLFEPIQYRDDRFDRYDNILYDYNKTIGHDKTEALYQAEIKRAMAMIKSDETKAEAEYILGNLRTIVKHYGNTPIAQHIKKSCDNWHAWL